MKVRVQFEFYRTSQNDHPVESNEDDTSEVLCGALKSQSEVLPSSPNIPLLESSAPESSCNSKTNTTSLGMACYLFDYFLASCTAMLEQIKLYFLQLLLKL